MRIIPFPHISHTLSNSYSQKTQKGEHLNENTYSTYFLTLVDLTLLHALVQIHIKSRANIPFCCVKLGIGCSGQSVTQESNIARTGPPHTTVLVRHSRLLILHWPLLLCSLKWACGPWLGGVGCPSRTKFWSSDFCFALKLNLGLDNFKTFFQNFLTSGSLTPMLSKISTIFLYDPIYGYIAAISDDAEMKDLEVGKSWILFHRLSRPRVIFGPKEKFEFEKKKFGRIAI